MTIENIYKNRETGVFETLEQVKTGFNEILNNSSEFDEYKNKFEKYLVEHYEKHDVYDVVTQEEALREFYNELCDEDEAKKKFSLNEFIEESSIWSAIEQPNNDQFIKELDCFYYVWGDSGSSNVTLIRK